MIGNVPFLPCLILTAISIPAFLIFSGGKHLEQSRQVLDFLQINSEKIFTQNKDPTSCLTSQEILPDSLVCEKCWQKVWHCLLNDNCAGFLTRFRNLSVHNFLFPLEASGVKSLSQMIRTTLTRVLSMNNLRKLYSEALTTQGQGSSSQKLVWRWNIWSKAMSVFSMLVTAGRTLKDAAGIGMGTTGAQHHYTHLTSSWLLDIIFWYF